MNMAIDHVQGHKCPIQYIGVFHLLEHYKSDKITALPNPALYNSCEYSENTEISA